MIDDAQNIEEIDKYINKLFQGSQFVKDIKNNEEKKEEEESKESELSETPVIGGRHKLKDSLDINNPSKNSNRSNNNTEKKENKSKGEEEVNDIINKNMNKKTKELIKNTMRNSKILAPEDLANVQNYKKPDVSKRRKSAIRFVVDEPQKNPQEEEIGKKVTIKSNKSNKSNG